MNAAQTTTNKKAGRPLRERLDDHERDIIENTLRRNGGNMANAAERLGMPLRTFWYRCDRLGIDRDAFRE